MIVPRNQAFNCNPFLKDKHQELPAGKRAEVPGLPDVRLGDFVEAVFGGISTVQPDMFQIGDPFKQCGRNSWGYRQEKWGASPFRRSRSEWSDIYPFSMTACRLGVDIYR